MARPFDHAGSTEDEFGIIYLAAGLLYRREYNWMEEVQGR